MQGRARAPEQRADLVGQGRGHELVGVDVEQPGPCALLLGKALLGTVAAPGLAEDAGTGGAGDVEGGVGRARVDHHDLGGEAGHGGQRLAQPLSLVAGDQEDRQAG
jgi:hypothetical protein